jgi:hypothetical protein
VQIVIYDAFNNKSVHFVGVIVGYVIHLYIEEMKYAHENAMLFMCPGLQILNI